jgi:amino acid transporter
VTAEPLGIDSHSPLKRDLSLVMLVLYGLGTTVGAGIYVLVGKVAGSADVYAPLSFLLAALIAAPTALSFGELAARYPHSAGEAVYAEEAFGHRGLATVIGLAVVFIGLVSSATIAAGAVGYLQKLVAVPTWLGLVLVVAGLALVAAWGISESVIVAGVATIFEIGGLLFIVWCGRDGLDPARYMEVLAAGPPLSAIGVAGILSGAVLAFYAFIGFEDMVNVVEEVRDPSRNMALAIMITLVVTTILYAMMSFVSVTAMPIAELASSGSPVSDIFERLTGLPTAALDVLIVAAVVNGALVQIIMASRMLYGLARRNWLPPVFAMVGKRTRTPLFATFFVAAGAVAMAAAFPIEALARVTSLITLLIFVAVNASLLRLRGRAVFDKAPRRLHAAVPAAGLLFSLGLAGFQVLAFLGAAPGQ